MRGDPVDREIRLALWKLHILHHAAKGPVYGLWMLEELAEHGHRLSPGTLYPLLARMEEHGWLRSTTAGGGPKARREYRITDDGLELLATLRGEVAELYRELVLGLYRELVLGEEPEHAPAHEMREKQR